MTKRRMNITILMLVVPASIITFLTRPYLIDGIYPVLLPLWLIVVLLQTWRMLRNEEGRRD